MTPRKRNLITGIVVLGAVGTLVWMVLRFTGSALGLFQPEGMPVVFVADRADGLSDGSPVYYAGVEVGKVTAVHLLSDRVHVSIDGRINSDAPLPRNVSGEIKSQSSLGTSTQINLSLDGPADGPLAPGGQIKLRYTGASLLPPAFTDFLDQAKRQELVKHVDQAIVTINEQAQRIGDVLADPKLQQDLKTTMANVREVTDRANKIGVKLDTLTDNANATLTDVRGTVGDAKNVIAKTDKNIDQLARQLGSNLDKLGQTFQQFQEISEKINKGHGTAGALINDPKLYDELSATAKELNVVAASLQRLMDQWEHEGVYLNLGKK